MQASWQFWVDRGGTFTDVVARRPDGQLITHKLLSENPAHYENAALQGIRDVLGLAGDQAIPPALLDEVRMGTTLGTNALLERTGEPVLLAITQGFADALRIAYQNRPDIFARRIELPSPLYQQVIEIEERVDAKGQVLTPLNIEHTQRSLQTAFAQGLRSIAIVCLHGYRYPQHEQRIADMARAVGFTQISTSHQTSPLIKLVSRGDTTVVDAYLTPVLKRYVQGVTQALGDTRLRFMQSNGGLVDAHRFQGRDSILSGPAGGIVGMVQVGSAAGFDKLIGFDMGGTSTDVSHYAGELERRFDTQVAGVRMRVPMLNIHTVAAGGGSILHFDGLRFRVGPDSAGANPGPACYGQGGPLTVTDCNVMLGKLDARFFPQVFGEHQDQPLDVDQVTKRFAELADTVSQATGQAHTPPTEVAEGFLRIAVDNMANAIKKISTQNGYDVSQYTLCCFGGAGGQHACLVANELGIKRVLIHPYAGVLSAYGLGQAALRNLHERSVEAPLLAQLLPHLNALYAELNAAAQADLQAQGMTAAQIQIHQRIHLRYQGTDTSLPLVFADLNTLHMAFAQAHQQHYGFVREETSLVVESISVEGLGRLNDEATVFKTRSGDIPAPIATTKMRSGGETFASTPIYQRDALPAGAHIVGPAMILDSTGTNIIERGWEGRITESLDLILTLSSQTREPAAMDTIVPSGKPLADPVMLEIFNNLFMSIADQMGVTLANTAYSVNIKERLDFSCALFDAQGQLIANAPHVPVHLGSMGDSVQALLDEPIEKHPGDVFMLNNPYCGGTHLPDVTVITPVYENASASAPLLFYVASRGHHADIGGITPGSMPAHSRHIEQEGVLIDVFKLVKQEQWRDSAIRELLCDSTYPVRNIEQNLADLRAQVAANRKGAQELLRMVKQFSLSTVQAYMQHVQDNAEEQVRRAIMSLHDGQFRYEMDNGAAVQVSLHIDRTQRSAMLDFAGTSAQQDNNFNAPVSVCKAAVLYVFRTLVDEDIPLNAGCLKPLDIRIPAGSLLKPHFPAAVVAGNVETSQYVTDTLYGALSVMAASQGTMNNLTFGNAQHQYYETLCGGAGAGDGFAGADAVHTHMTNSRLTDPEILEWRFPVRLEDFHIRTGSGGAGRYCGGNGVLRKIRFLEPMQAAILSGHRTVPPYGMAGGKEGAVGCNRVERANGEIEVLAATAQIELHGNDCLIIETPGGGGYGTPE